MIAEALIYLGSPVPRALRRLSYVGDSIALWSRARRCRRAWAEHERNCQRVVIEAFADLPRRRTALILGSGLARDIPIDALCDAFESVILLDVVHLLPVRLRLARRNVVFVTADLTGCADWLTGRAGERGDPLAPLIARDDIDLVVSANVLSQLPIALERWADAHRDGPPGGPADLPRAAIDWHLADLTRFTCRVCLLTDVGLSDVEAGGRVIDRFDLLRGQSLPEPDERWDWLVAPLGEESRHHAVIHHVQAYREFPGRAGQNDERRERSAPSASE